MKKTLGTILVVFLFLSLIVGCHKRTETYPSRTIELIIPFSEGGASDITARQFVVSLEKELGTTITCVNKSSGGTVEGLEFAYAQDADGYTLFWLTNSVLMKQAQNAAKVKFTESFEPLYMVCNDLTVIMVKADSQFKSMQDVIAYAKANPGDLLIAGTSPGGFDDYQVANVCDELDIELTYVPYSGGSEVKAAVLGKEVDIYQDKIASCLSLIQSGDVIPIAVIASEPITSIPELSGVPTLKQLGANFDVSPWRGLSVRSDCDPSIVKKLKETCDVAYNSAEFQDFLAKNHMKINKVIPQKELKTRWINEVNSYRPFYEQRGLIK